MVAVADGQGTVLAEYVYWPTGLSRACVRDPAGAELNWNRLWQGQRIGLEDGMYNRGGRLYDPFSGTTASPADGAASRVADPNVSQSNLPDTTPDAAPGVTGQTVGRQQGGSCRAGCAGAETPAHPCARRAGHPATGRRPFPPRGAGFRR